MIVRDLIATDLPLLYAMHDNQFPFPDLKNHLYMVKKVAQDKDGIIGTGIVRLTSEAILITDQTRPRSTRVKAVARLADAMLIDTKATGMDECHVFVRNSNIEHIVERIGFKKCRGGIPMVLHF